MNWKHWVLGIAATLVGSAITSSVQSSGRAEAAEVRVHVLETRIEKHEETLMKIVPLLERIDERVGEIRRRVERLENATK